MLRVNFHSSIVKRTPRPQSGRGRVAAAMRERAHPVALARAESVGSEQLHAVTSLLVQALVHILKAQARPLSREAPHWESEARRFRGNAADRFAPSTRQRIDVERFYRRALRVMPDTINGQAPLPVPVACRVTLDELLSDGT
jgi:hypothetical protein